MLKMGRKVRTLQLEQHALTSRDLRASGISSLLQPDTRQ
jgi:hypothetical protein